MSGSENNTTGKELREFVRVYFPEFFIITRKVTNTHAVLYHRRSGQEVIRFTSNYSMLHRLRVPPTPKMPRGLLGDVDFKAIQTKEATQLAEKALHLVLEAEEWMETPLFVNDSIQTRSVVLANPATLLTKAESYETKP